nr:reverse transcriptase domain-containing protein [Tanacetum cinerariifolium]GFB52134.1 reverse transcriptase domain-containing protein [Tanacetum cinerariifolium]
MTLELADRSITCPKGVVEDVFVKVGKFHFPTDFVVVDFEADPRVPIILGRSFLRTGRALIDVYGEEITLRVNDEAFTFNLNQTTRYSSTYDDMSENRIDIIDVAREEYAQEMLGFSNNFSGGSPTLISEPIISNSSTSLTSFEGSDFILEESKAYLKDELDDQKLHEKATNQMEKFFQIFQDFHFDISFADALLLMPKFASTIKSLLANKDKFFKLAKISLNENYSVMLLKKLSEKLGNPGKFLIPCDFQ